MVDAVLAADPPRSPRALSTVERDPAGALAAALHRHGGRAHVVGVTGVPRRATHRGSADPRLARRSTVAGSPSTPSSRCPAAPILGDRVRMDAGPPDDGVFIRSMANRGAVGGLALAASSAVQVLDAARYDVVVVETVGAPARAVEIADERTTVVVVSARPGRRRAALKAGILKVADVFALNKADLPQADAAAAQIERC
ncbi:MAG: hypothetical protein U0470_14400 [Anaerolineae bacterium]